MKSLLFISLLAFSSVSLSDVSAQVSIENSFARAAIQQQRNSAAFMQITNSGEAAAVVYAKSPVAKIVELHTHLNDNGVMRMRKIKQIDLPTAKTVSLQPGGLHIMLLGLNRDLKIDDSIEVTLGFDDGSEKQLTLPVKMVKHPMKKGMKGHDMMKPGKPSLMSH